MYTAKIWGAQAHHRHFFEVLKSGSNSGILAKGYPSISGDEGIDLEDRHKDREDNQQDDGGHDDDQ